MARKLEWEDGSTGITAQFNVAHVRFYYDLWPKDIRHDLWQVDLHIIDHDITVWMGTGFEEAKKEAQEHFDGIVEELS